MSEFRSKSYNGKCTLPFPYLSPLLLCAANALPSFDQAVEDCEMFTLQRSKFREMLALSVSASLVQRVAWMQSTSELVRLGGKDQEVHLLHGREVRRFERLILQKTGEVKNTRPFVPQNRGNVMLAKKLLYRYTCSYHKCTFKCSRVNQSCISSPFVIQPSLR